MDQLEAVRRALLEPGNRSLSREELAEHVRERYGVTVRPAFIPILKATLMDLEMLAHWKQRSLAATPVAEPPPIPAISDKV